MYKVEPTKLDLPPLVRMTPGYYYELLIQNCTSDNIVIIDHDNNRIPIAPITTTPLGAEFVQILWRRSLKGTTNEANSPRAITGYQVKIPKHVLIGQGSIYIKAINVVICSESAALSVTHPAAAIDYDTALCELKEQVTELARDIPTISLIANDPEGRYSKLYTVVGDMPVCIPVTNIFGEANLKIIFSCGGRTSEYNISLDEFFKSTDNVMELDDCPINFITTNKSVSERSSGEYKKISQAEANRLIKQQADKHKVEIDVLKEQNKTELQLKDKEIDVLQSKLKTAKAEYDRIKSEYDAFSGNVNASYKIGEHELKRDSAISSANEEKWKTFGVYGGLALGAITLILKAVELGRKSGLV